MSNDQRTKKGAENSVASDRIDRAEKQVGDEEEFPDDPIRSWSNIIASIRDSCSNKSEESNDNRKMIDNGSVQASRILGTESDDADMVGDLGQFLNGMISSIEKETDRLRALENAKRLPPFARRDSVIAIRAHLEESKARGKQCVYELTSLLTNDVMFLLNSKAAMLHVCDALEALAIAWQVPKRNHAASRSTTESSQLIHEARRLVDIATQAVQANSRRRRVAMAADSMKQQQEAQLLSNEWYVLSNEGTSGGGRDSDYNDLHEQGQQSCSVNGGQRNFDVYGRKPLRKVGKAAREVGKQRKVKESGSIHLSRHCEYEPSFNDMSGLALGTSQMSISSTKIKRNHDLDGKPGARSATLNTSSVFRAVQKPEAKRWVLDESYVEAQTNSAYQSCPPPPAFSSFPSANDNSFKENTGGVDMTALQHYQQRLSVSIPGQRKSGIRGEIPSSKKSMSVVSPQLTF